MLSARDLITLPSQTTILLTFLLMMNVQD
jgi:hypothetical protein